MRGEVMKMVTAATTSTVFLTLVIAIWNIINHEDGEPVYKSDAAKVKLGFSIGILFLLIAASAGFGFNTNGEMAAGYGIPAVSGMVLCIWNWYEYDNPPTSQKQVDNKFYVSIVALVLTLLSAGGVGVGLNM